jgi:hypothetical protein
MSKKPYIKIPTNTNGVWDYTEFLSRDSFRVFVKSCFKEPGTCGFNEVSKRFNEQAKVFSKKGLYCEAPEGSRDYITYWDTEKEKSRKGVIFSDGSNSWYLPRDLYFWWNFLKIADKEKKTEAFPEVWDVHYYMALYNILAQLYDKHSGILKKRQIGSSLYHMAKLINLLWFEKSQILKMGASAKDYINNDKGSWLILDYYRDFLNKHTGWYRPMSPDKSASMSWQQRLEVKENGRISYEGNSSKVTGTSFEKNATAGVGGPCRLFFHEEAGIAPKMGETFEFMRPALSMGGILTGQFIAAGSVGNLDHCEPLKNMIKKPHSHSIYAVQSTLINENGDEAETGLFIPEQWGRPPHIDQYGNSLVQKALEAIKRERHVWEYGDKETKEEPLDKEKLQLRISQHPINIDEAFAIRKTSLFPNRYVKPQIQRIEDSEYKLEYVDLERNEKGEVITIPSKRLPLTTDASMTTPDKRACVVIHEHPIPGKIPLKTYLGSIDPVAGDKSITSESMACIYIYKMPTLRMHTTADGKKESSTEGGKIVAWWTGRYDDINETNEQLSMLVEYYQSYTTCEYNVGSWVNYMIGKRRSRYVAVKEDMIFDKEAGVTQNSMNNYGWYNTPQTWKKMLEEGINYISQALLTTYKDDGTVERVKYAVETIPDIWLLKEMQQYQVGDGRNYDRIITYCALVAFVGLRLSNMPGMYTEVINSTSNGSTDSKKLGSMDSVRIFKENTQTFRNLLGQLDDSSSHRADYSKYKKRSAFKHLK